MPDEASTPPADTQAPPSEPTPPPEQVSESPAEPTPPQESTPAPESTPPETPAPTEAQASVSEPAPEPVPAQQSNPQPQQSNSAPAVPTLSSSVQDYGGTLHGDIVKARAKIQETKHKKLDKIMARMTEKGKITNDEVEKLLHISDATATRYLQALEKENKIKQTGVTGKAVFYEKI